MRLDAFSLVEPDVFVVHRDALLDPDDAVPAAAVSLVVEVSVTTQARDRGPRLAAYAKAGVPEVWLIDPRPQVGEPLRHRHPDGASYRRVDRHVVGEDAGDLDVSSLPED